MSRLFEVITSKTFFLHSSIIKSFIGFSRVRVRLTSPPAIPTTPKPVSLPLNICQICHQEFPKRLLYKKHMLTHLGEKHFACTYPVDIQLILLFQFDFNSSFRHVKILFILNRILIVMFERCIYVPVIHIHVHFLIVEKHLHEMIH